LLDQKRCHKPVTACKRRKNQPIFWLLLQIPTEPWFPARESRWWTMLARRGSKGKTDGAGALIKVTCRRAFTLSKSRYKVLKNILSLKVNLKLSLASASTTIEVTADTLGVVDVGMLATVSDSDRHAAPMSAPVRYQPMR
jgi:hypothetical protein